MVDLDIEEKKVQQTKGANSNFLTVDYSGKAPRSNSNCALKKKDDDAKSDKSGSQLSDDIFYTCPQIEEDSSSRNKT